MTLTESVSPFDGSGSAGSGAGGGERLSDEGASDREESISPPPPFKPPKPGEQASASVGEEEVPPGMSGGLPKVQGPGQRADGEDALPSDSMNERRLPSAAEGRRPETDATLIDTTEFSNSSFDCNTTPWVYQAKGPGSNGPSTVWCTLVVRLRFPQNCL